MNILDSSVWILL